MPIRGVVDYLEGCTTLPPIRIRELVRVSVGISIPVELFNWLLIGRYRVYR